MMEMKTHAKIEVRIDHVSVFNELVFRPKSVAVSEWISFWERISEIAEDEDFGSNPNAHASEMEFLKQEVKDLKEESRELEREISSLMQRVDDLLDENAHLIAEIAELKE